MKLLHEIERGSKIVVDCSDGSNYVVFNHLDGMYSHCTTEKGGTIHLSVGTPLDTYSGDNPELKGMYEITANPKE